MALLKVICWIVVFITRLRFPPGKSSSHDSEQADHAIRGKLCEWHLYRFSLSCCLPLSLALI